MPGLPGMVDWDWQTPIEFFGGIQSGFLFFDGFAGDLIVVTAQIRTPSGTFGGLELGQFTAGPNPSLIPGAWSGPIVTGASGIRSYTYWKIADGGDVGYGGVDYEMDGGVSDTDGGVIWLHIWRNASDVSFAYSEVSSGTDHFIKHLPSAPDVRAHIVTPEAEAGMMMGVYVGDSSQRGFRGILHYFFGRAASANTEFPTWHLGPEDNEVLELGLFGGAVAGTATLQDHHDSEIYGVGYYASQESAPLVERIQGTLAIGPAVQGSLRRRRRPTGRPEDGPSLSGSADPRFA